MRKRGKNGPLFKTFVPLGSRALFSGCDLSRAFPLPGAREGGPRGRMGLESNGPHSWKRVLKNNFFENVRACLRVFVIACVRPCVKHHSITPNQKWRGLRKDGFRHGRFLPADRSI